MAILTSWMGDRFHPASVRRLASNSGQLSRAAHLVAESLRDGRHSGLVLDLEGLAATDLRAMLGIVRTLSDTLRAGRLGPLVVAVPARDTSAYPARPLIDAGATFVLPMLYDLHWSGGTPGPVVEAGWAKAALGQRVREVGADRVIAGLPLYGYRWPRSGTGETVTHGEAMRASAAAGTRMARDSASGALRALLPTGAQIWVTDAPQIRQLLEVCDAAGVRRIALWYVGQEDPAVWQVLRDP
jgi:spore germination protein YaaH